MGLRFFLGRTGTGKTEAIRSEIVRKLKDDPADSRAVIYLVPDQMTFQAEQDLAEKTGTGLIRAQVLSFSRMAWNVLQETGGITKTYLQQYGIHMLIRKVIEEEKENFRLYKKASNKTGFIEQVEQLITECKRQTISTDQLHEKVKELEEKEEKTGQEQVLSDKLHDLLIVWEKTEDFLGNHYAGAEDYLKLLAEKIPDSSYLSHADVYIDGFHAFTPQELQVLKALMEHTDEISIALTLDQPYDEELPSMLDLFYQPAATYQKVNLLGRNSSQHVENIILYQQNQKYKTEGLRHLEQYFEKRPVISGLQDNDIVLRSAVNRRTEIEAAAREINQLVRQGYRYKDIAVISRNIGDYSEMLYSVFHDYGIPLFMDQVRPMLNHPVVECIRSSLEALTTHWRYEPLFRAWKTDMFFALSEDWESAKEEVDQLENYVLAYGVQEKHWKQKEDWSYTKVRSGEENAESKTVENTETEKRLNDSRKRLAAPLQKLEKKMKKAATMKEYSTELYMFLEELKIPEKIEKIRDKDLNRNDFSKAREHEQVWSSIIELLEQIVEMAGEEKATFNTFYEMMETGLSSINFSIVPPAVDQVTAADMERSRFGDVRAAFVLGVNEGILPAAFEEEGILSDEDRHWFSREGLELADDASLRLLNEQFLTYRALTLPAEKLYVSYPLADEEGSSLQPSIIINHIKELFPTLEDTLLFNEPQEYSETQQEAFAGANRKTLSFLTYQLQRWKQGYPVAPMWWDVYNWYVVHQKTDSLNIVVNSLFYKNKAAQVPAAVTRQLYGQTLKASVSRVEQFESCAFAHFASYGLRLKEREIYKLEAPDIGQLFHGALKMMTEQMQSEGKQWDSLSLDECHYYARQSVSRIVPTIQRRILLSSHRYRYLQKKLEDTVVRASEMLKRQAEVSGFTPMGLELGFGPGEKLPPLQFTLADGTSMEVAGRIDRVDEAEGADGVYVRIIDYKSSMKNLRLSDIYYGLALQMLVYLDVVLSFSEEWLEKEVKPAGVLYFHVHNPFIQAARQMKTEELEQEFFKRFKMKGLLMAEEEPVRLMDESLSTGYSNVVPAAIKKDGTFYSNSSVLDDSQFDSLRTFIRNKLQSDGEKIMQGITEIKPFKHGQATACMYCSFKSVCQFDTSFEANDYRLLNQNKEEIITNLFSHDKEE